jgi:hypothetical protein
VFRACGHVFLSSAEPSPRSGPAYLLKAYAADLVQQNLLQQTVMKPMVLKDMLMVQGLQGKKHTRWKRVLSAPGRLSIDVQYDEVRGHLWLHEQQVLIT